MGLAVPAAGAGERLGGVRKAFLPVAGQPLLLHALAPFLAHARVTSVAIALPPDEVDDPPAWLKTVDPRIRLVPGGRTRMHSVKAALEALEESTDIALVHDAARPLVSGDIIDRCIEGATGGDGVIAAWPAVDTLKEVGSDGFVVATPDRSRFRRAQTPQAFPFRPLLNAYRRALDEGLAATDDAAVFVHFGGRVKVVEGGAWNLKVTHPEDLQLVEALFEARRRSIPFGMEAGMGDE